MAFDNLKSKSLYLEMLVISVVSFLARIPGIQRPLWKDELISLSTLHINIFQNPLLFGYTTNLPLFFYILNFVHLFFNPSNLWLFRIVPAIFNVGSILLLFLFLKNLFGSKTAWIASVLLCFAPIQIYYAQELRPYSLMQFLMVVNSISLYLFLVKNTFKAFPVFFITCFLIITTHYTGYYFLASESLLTICLLLKQKFADRKPLTAFLALATTGIVGLTLVKAMAANPAFLKSEGLLEIGGIWRPASNPMKETFLAFSRIKEVASLYYWFGLYYFSVDPIVQFIFKKFILLLMLLGIYFIYRGRKSNEVTVVVSSYVILLFSLGMAYLAEKLGYFPFGGRHIMPYTIFLYTVIAYVIAKLRLFGWISLIVLVAIFVSFHFCYTYGIAPDALYAIIPTAIFKTCFLRVF